MKVRETRRLAAQRAFDEQVKERQHMQDYIDRFYNSKRSSAQAAMVKQVSSISLFLSLSLSLSRSPALSISNRTHHSLTHTHTHTHTHVRQAMSKKKALEKMEILEDPSQDIDEDTIKLRFPDPAPVKKDIILQVCVCECVCVCGSCLL